MGGWRIDPGFMPQYICTLSPGPEPACWLSGDASAKCGLSGSLYLGGFMGPVRESRGQGLVGPWSSTLVLGFELRERHRDTSRWGSQVRMWCCCDALEAAETVLGGGAGLDGCPPPYLGAFSWASPSPHRLTYSLEPCARWVGLAPSLGPQVVGGPLPPPHPGLAPGHCLLDFAEFGGA